MDVISSVKMVILAASQYINSQNENTKSQLLRHIEVLLAHLKTNEIDKVFIVKDVTDECMSNLVAIISCHHKDAHIIDKIIQLLAVVVDNPLSCNFFLGNVNTCAPFMQYVIQHNEEDTLDSVKQCLVLLEKITYSSKLSESCPCLDKFLAIIFKEIKNTESSDSGVCLGILCNLVAQNIAVQAQAKGMIGATQIKTLMNFLRQDSMANKISVLSTITHMCWEDDLTKKLYNMKNVRQTIKLLFSRLSAFDDLLTQHRAADLCVELLKHTEIAQQFSIYETEHNFSCKLLMLLQEQIHPLAACKICEVVLAFCQISTVRHDMCLKMLNDDAAWQALLTAASRPLSKCAEEPAILALTLIQELCEEMIDSNIELSQSSWYSSLLSTLLQQLVPALAIEHSLVSDLLTTAGTRKTLKAMEILNTFSTDEKLRDSLVKSITCDCLSAVIDHQLTYNLTGTVQAASPAWSEPGVAVALSSLELALHLKPVSSHFENLLYSKLQDPRLVPFLAKAITGCNRPVLQTAFKLHQEALPLPDFPFIQLAEAVCCLNERNMQAVPTYPFTSNALPALLKNTDSICTSSDVLRPTSASNLAPQRIEKGRCSPQVQTVSSSEDKENVQILIDNIQTIGNEMESSGGNSSRKSSELIDVYENKIASLKMTQNQLQDLLEAKTLSLNQADRIINQNRFQIARAQEDAKKMADILRESEIRSEKLIEDVRAADCDRSAMERELQTVVEENRNLQKVADQYDRMQSAYQDNLHKMEVLERNLKASRQEYDTLKELHDMIQKHSEKMKRQHNQVTTRLEDVEEERMKLLKRVSELENSVSDLTQLVEEQDRSAQVLMKEKAERDVAIKNLKLQVGKRDECIKEFKIKVSSQENNKQQLEHQLKERASEIRRLHSEIDAKVRDSESFKLEVLQLGQALSEKDNEIANMKQKLDKQAQTLLMITELSNNIRGSQ